MNGFLDKWIDGKISGTIHLSTDPSIHFPALTPLLETQ